MTEYGGHFFRFPDPPTKIVPLNNGTIADYGYTANICRDLFFAKQYRNYNILTMSNVFYLLEHDHCCLVQSDLYENNPHT